MEVVYFSVALAEEEVLVGKVLKKLPECVEESTLRMQISAILFSLTFFQVSCVSPIAEAVFVALITTSGNVLYRAVGFIYAHSWQTVHASLPAQILTDM